MDDRDKSLRVTFPHPYFGQWFSSNFQGPFEEQVALLFGNHHAIHYDCGQQGAAVPPIREPQSKSLPRPFGSQFTFDSFITNNKNHFPLVSAKEVASQKDIQFNPFIICGDPASGKTHLLKAVANDLTKVYERNEIFYGSLEDMVTIYADRFADDPLRGRRFFQNHKCLLMDDLQQVKEHPKFQDELVELFNHFHDAKRQMVFSCAGRLVDYDFLAPKLKSRLEWGLIITLKEPDLDVRVKYIQNMCKAKRIKLSKEQVLTLAQRFTDLRLLQGVLLKFFAFKKLVHKNIQDKEFNQILSHAMGENNNALDPKQIIALVADHFQLPTKTLTGSKRDHNIVFARQVAMYLVRQLVGSSYPTLGKLFGGKDHSTAMYAVSKIETLQGDDPETNRLLTGLKKKCLALHKE